MAKTDFKSVDEYLATMPEPTRKVLERVRAIIRKELPDADEVISYQIPTYKKDGVPVIYFAGWKEHFSLYPVGEGFPAAFPDLVEKYPIAKGTIRLPLKDGVPADLVKRVVRYREREAAKEAKEKAAKKAAKRTKKAGA